MGMDPLKCLITPGQSNILNRKAQTPGCLSLFANSAIQTNYLPNIDIAPTPAIITKINISAYKAIITIVVIPQSLKKDFSLLNAIVTSAVLLYNTAFLILSPNW